MIRKIDTNGAVTTFAGSGAAAYGAGTGQAASFNGPTGITASSTHLYVVDTGNYAIRKIQISDAAVTLYAGGSVTESTGVATQGTPGAAASAAVYEMRDARGIAI